MNIVRSILRHVIRAVIAIAAVANLLLIFLWSYNIPANLQTRIDKIIYGDRRKAVEVAESGETVEPTPEPLSARLVIPSQAMNYTGGSLDLLDGIYVEYQDGSRLEELDIETEIEEGSSRLEKIVNYKTVLDDGQELTGKRSIRIGSRYTGPTLTVAEDLPDVTMDEDMREVVREQILAGNVYAEDGFGNDITYEVQGRFDRDRNEEGELVYKFVMYVTNAAGDTADMALGDDFAAGGIVMRLTTYELTLNVGTPFYFQDYIKECHDAAGNDLHGSIHVEGSVNSYVVGDYEIQVYCVDSSGKSSAKRTLKVHIV